MRAQAILIQNLSKKSGEFKGQPLNKMPKHMLNIGLDYDVSDRWNTWMDYNYRGKTSDYLSRTSMASGTPSLWYI